MYCLEKEEKEPAFVQKTPELIKYDVSNTSYYVEVENGTLLCDVVRLWKTILGGHGKSWKSYGNF